MDILTVGIRDFIFSLKTYLTVPKFIKDNQLWKGFEQHRLVLIAVALLGILFGLTFISAIMDWWSKLSISSVTDVGIQAAGLVEDVVSTGYDFFFNGMYKYLVIILMEMLIFHMALRTNEILNGKSEALTPGVFMRAQIRMIKVSLFSFVMELIISIILGVILGLLDFEFLESPINFVVECFFLGFLLIDNFNEINHMGISESYKTTLHYPGASIAIGLVLYVLILLPLIGPVIGPMVGAIAATLIMHQLSKRHDGDPLTNPSY